MQTKKEKKSDNKIKHLTSFLPTDGWWHIGQESQSSNEGSKTP